MDNIVVGIDGTTGSRTAVDWALREARAHGARLDAVLAWNFPPPVNEYYFPTREELKAESQTVVDKVMGELDHEGVEMVARCVEGAPGPALVAAATDADLLVVGANGHRALVGMLLGSVSLYAVTHARVPVVVIPLPPDHQTDDITTDRTTNNTRSKEGT